MMPMGNDFVVRLKLKISFESFHIQLVQLTIEISRKYPHFSNQLLELRRPPA